MTRSPHGPELFVQYMCENVIDNLEHTVVYTMQTVNIVLPLYFLAKFDIS